MATSNRWMLARQWIVYSAAILAGAAGLLFLMLLLAGVFEPKVDSSIVATETSPPATKEGASLRTDTVRRILRKRHEAAVGTARPVHESAVAAKLLARVLEVRVKAGQAVSEGEVLVKLDDAELTARLKQAEAAVAAAEARYARAKSDYARAEQLVSSRAISRAEFDEFAAELEISRAELERANKSVEEAKVLLDYATIRAPLSGIVVDKRVEVGDTVSPGQVLLTLYDPKRMQMVASVRESLAERLHVGDQIPARLDALGHDCVATISEIVPEAEAASRSFAVKVTGPCPPGVYSGMFGRIFIPLDDEEVLIVPRNAVFRVGQLSLVEVVEKDQMRRRVVQLGRELPEGYEVLAGLREGEQVVLRPTDVKPNKV